MINNPQGEVEVDWGSKTCRDWDKKKKRKKEKVTRNKRETKRYASLSVSFTFHRTKTDFGGDS